MCGAMRFAPTASSFDVPAEAIALDDPLATRFQSSALPARPPLLKSSAPGTDAFPMTAAGDLVGFICVEHPKDTIRSR